MFCCVVLCCVVLCCVVLCCVVLCCVVLCCVVLCCVVLCCPKIGLDFPLGNFWKNDRSNRLSKNEMPMQHHISPTDQCGHTAKSPRANFVSPKQNSFSKIATSNKSL